jgi:hypothetical protein
LALAVLDDAPLCARCLKEALKNGDAHLLKRIEPLTISTMGPPGSIQTARPKAVDAQTSREPR